MINERTSYALDWKGQNNLHVTIVPSAVGLIGLCIVDLGGVYDIARSTFERWIETGTARPCSWVGNR